MTNEQLAVLIQEGHTEYIVQLWEQVEKFVAWKARRACATWGCLGGATFEDFYQAGFLAVDGAVKHFDSNYDCKFLTFLDYCLRKEFSAAMGMHRSRKQPFDAVDLALSLDAPVGGEDGLSLFETLPDKNADQVFSAVVEHDAFVQKKKAVLEAIAALSDQQRNVLHYIYWNRCTQAETAEKIGLTEREVEKIAHDAIRKLRHPKVSRRLEQYVSA